MHIEQQQIHCDRPTLILGVIGFSRQRQAAIRAVVESFESPVAWRLGSREDADAWWVNGGRARLQADGSLRIGGGEPGAGFIHLSLSEVDRPIAFSQPLSGPEFEPAYSFRVEDRASMRAILATLQTQWLASTAARRWLAGRLAAVRGGLAHPVYHVAHAGRLLAVVDRSGEVGIARGASVEELEDATWSSRPFAAGSIPASFHRTTIDELVRSHAHRHGPSGPAFPMVASVPSAAGDANGNPSP